MFVKTYQWTSSLFPAHVQAFLGSVLAAILVPLTPLAAELAVNGSIKADTWAITAVTFTSAVAVTSRNQLVLLLGMTLAAIMAFTYGVELSAAKTNAILTAVAQSAGTPLTVPAHPEGTPLGAVIIILLIAAIHIVERMGLHLVQRRPFLEVRTK